MHVKIDYDNSYKCGIIKSAFLENIRNHFSATDKTAEIKKRMFGNNFYSTRKYIITPLGRFPILFFDEILKYIVSIDKNAAVEVTEKFKAVYNKQYSFYNEDLVELNRTVYNARNYQLEAVTEALKKGYGTILIPTGGGKTYVMATLIETVRKYSSKQDFLAFIIVPNLILVEQTYKDFLNFGISRNIISKWSGSNDLEPKSNIIICCASILYSKKQDLSILSKIDLLIQDETHKIKSGNILNDIIKSIKTPHKFGFTGTLPAEKIDQWNLFSKIGSIIYSVERENLVENDFISDVLIKILLLDYKSKNPESKNLKFLEKYRSELEFLMHSEFRNNIIKKICTHLYKNTLVLTDRIAHGEIIYKKLSEITNKRVFFIKGDIEIDDRENIRNLMESENNIICVAISQIFSTGVSIHNLHYILLAQAGKAKIKLIQSIGRSLRIHKDKKKAIVFDIADDLHFGKKHLLERLKIYDIEGLKSAIIKIKED